MTDSDLQRGFNSVAVGITQEQLEAMSDTSLALWQAENNKQQTREHLAKYEWQRRTAERQLKARFALDKQLAKTGRMWGLIVALVGVVGTLLGVMLGDTLRNAPSAIQPARITATPPAHTTQQPTEKLVVPSAAPGVAPTTAPAPVVSDPAIKKAP